MSAEKQIRVRISLHEVAKRKIAPAAHDKWEHLRATLALTVPEGHTTRDALRACLNEFRASRPELCGYHPYGELDATFGEHRGNLQMLALLLSNGTPPELCLQADILPL